MSDAIPRARVLLADEPTGNVDSTRAHELLALLREMVDADALTILMVTHDRELANSFSDRIIVMRDGRVMEDERLRENVMKAEQGNA